MKTNFNLNENFNPFVTNIIDKGISSIPIIPKVFFKDILTETDPTKRIPLIPSIYFNNNDSIGSQIINKYYTIKITLEKLETIKKFIIFLLESSKYDLKKIKISKLKYKLVSDNLIMKKESKIDKILDEFNQSAPIAKSNNTFSMLKGSDQNIFYPKMIFQSKCNKDPESKTYFLKLIDKYINIRQKLIKLLYDNPGLLALSFVFDLEDKLLHEKMIKKEISKKNKSKNNNNLNKYILYGKNTTSSVISTPTGTRIPPVSPDENMINKINHYDILYKKFLSEPDYINKHNTLINEYFDSLKESIDNHVGSGSEDNLYNVVKTGIELDFNAIRFIFYYVKIDDFVKFLHNHILITNNIEKGIDKFSLYYDSYIEWYNNYPTEPIPPSNNTITDESNFKAFFDSILKSIPKTLSKTSSKINYNTPLGTNSPIAKLFKIKTHKTSSKTSSP
jgi:hypothetical protein